MPPNKMVPLARVCVQVGYRHVFAVGLGLRLCIAISLDFMIG